MRCKTLFAYAGVCLTTLALNQSPAKSSFAMSAIVYEHVDLSRGEGYGTTVYFGKNSYGFTNNFASFFPFLNDSISFIEVMPYCKADIYTNANGNGYYASLDNRKNNTILKVNLATPSLGSFNDQVSSIYTSCDQ